MATLDTELRLVAQTLISDLGKLVDFSVPATKTYDPTTGIVTEGAITVHSVKVSPPERYEERFVDEDLIRARDLRISLAALGLAFTPDLAMLVTIDSIAFDIIHITPVYSGELIALYELQLRQ